MHVGWTYSFDRRVVTVGWLELRRRPASKRSESGIRLRGKGYGIIVWLVYSAPVLPLFRVHGDQVRTHHNLLISLCRLRARSPYPLVVNGRVTPVTVPFVNSGGDGEYFITADRYQVSAKLRTTCPRTPDVLGACQR